MDFPTQFSGNLRKNQKKCSSWEKKNKKRKKYVNFIIICGKFGGLILKK